MQLLQAAKHLVVSVRLLPDIIYMTGRRKVKHVFGKSITLVFQQISCFISQHLPYFVDSICHNIYLDLFWGKGRQIGGYHKIESRFSTGIAWFFLPLL
jgi:hypothetical protein